MSYGKINRCKRTGGSTQCCDTQPTDATPTDTQSSDDMAALTNMLPNITGPLYSGAAYLGLNVVVNGSEVNSASLKDAAFMAGSSFVADKTLPTISTYLPGNIANMSRETHAALSAGYLALYHKMANDVSISFKDLIISMGADYIGGYLSNPPVATR